ncbi:MAG: hypothetical protein M1813_009150 [Trichoglossum hirsutum]|nr:MAG: hypothetical protein M1813_009150 [Trichoglossum hirsutum]
MLYILEGDLGNNSFGRIALGGFAGGGSGADAVGNTPGRVAGGGKGVRREALCADKALAVFGSALASLGGGSVPPYRDSGLTRLSPAPIAAR